MPRFIQLSIVRGCFLSRSASSSLERNSSPGCAGTVVEVKVSLLTPNAYTQCVLTATFRSTFIAYLVRIAHMRKSAQKHTLAVLRLKIGLGQKELAELVECSRPTIQSIELGRLELSDKLADRIARETGVALAWLKNNDVKKRPLDYQGAPYTREVFDRVQADSAMKDEYMSDAIARLALVMHTGRVAGLLLSARKRGEFSLCSY